MIEHIWSIACERSTTDRETNNLSLLNILEQVNLLGPAPDPAAKMALPLHFELTSLWCRSNPDQAEESIGRIKMRAPNGAEILESEFPVDLTQNIRMRTQMRSIAFPLLGTGRYTFTVEIRRADGNWEHVARIPLQVESLAQVAAAPGEPTGQT